MRAAFVYPNPRSEFRAAWERGDGPDTPLLGANHLAEHGIDAFVHDPALGGEGRLRWHLREVALPWELRRADVAVTTLYRIFPPLARLARRPRTVVFGYALTVMLRHAPRLRRELERAALRAPARILCLGESQRRDFVELSGFPPERVAVVRLGTDERFYVPGSEADADPRFVLAVGKDFARDYGTLVAALAPLDLEVQLVCHPRNLVGLTLPANVTAGRDFPMADLLAMYRRAACVVLPQHGDDYHDGTEAGGLTALLEAMAMARPIVASDRAVIREYVRDGESALLVPPDDPAALRAAVERVLGDRDLAARLGAAARATVERELTTRDMAASLAPILREVAGR